MARPAGPRMANGAQASRTLRRVVSEFANSDGFRVVLYLVTIAACAVAWYRERGAAGAGSPAFWALSAVVLFSVFAVRMTGGLEALGDLGREHAHAAGWYADRRPYQAVAVVALGGTWLLTTFVTIWRIPERRRRYLPFILVMLAILFFGAARAVSLHHIDSVLYRTDIAEVRVVVWIDGSLWLAAAMLAGVLAAGAARGQREPSDGSASPGEARAEHRPAEGGHIAHAIGAQEKDPGTICRDGEQS